MSLTLQVICGALGSAVLAALVARCVTNVRHDNVSNEVLLGGQRALVGEDEVESVKLSPWPHELPGITKIEFYGSLKKQVLEESLGEGLDSASGIRLRHALMERCQVHVAWLLRLEMEQRSIERMVRRGMMSESDFRKFSRFAELLDAEVNEVREEAGWLRDSSGRYARASTEIWRVAVQIWHQRRQCDRVKMRGGIEKREKNPVANENSSILSGPSSDKGFKMTQWPETLPSARSIQKYEALKAKCLAEDECPDATQHLRAALMERCQKQVPWMLRLQQERERMRAATERAQWQSDASPSAADFRQFQDFEEKCTLEASKVSEEADWLGRRDGTPGMGDRIWSMAFEAHAKANTHETLRHENHEKMVRAYPESSAKPWPSELAGHRQRRTYDQMKANVLNRLSQSAQAAMLEGRPAPLVVGKQVACQLRAALMARCQQVIPVIQRLQAEGLAFKDATEAGCVDPTDAARFEAIDTSIKLEYQSVKREAEWLSDHTGTRIGMGEQIWPAAFQLYSKRRAEVANQIHAAQSKRAELPLLGVVMADAVD